MFRRMLHRGVWGAACALVPLALAAQGGGPTPPPASRPDREYRVIVASEATDELAMVVFGAKGISIERTVPVGINIIDPDGPHGVGVAPDGKTFYVTTAHGTPYGSLWKFDARSGNVLGHVELGNFPATLQVSPDGSMVYAVNFNLHGEMVPSKVSIVSVDPFIEVARLTTCTMPHGSRLSPDGSHHYSACMMDDMLVEIDTREFSVSRHFMLGKGREHGMTGPPAQHRPASADHDMGGHGMEPPKPGDVSCSPTWAQPSADGRSVFVACNKASDIVEIDVSTWTMKRRLPAGEGIYNLGVTHDGRLLVGSNKRGRSVSVIEIASGKEVARIATQRRVVHGVAITADDRYAFISVEGVGSEPGTVEVIDLRALTRVASVDVGQMAGGIDVLPD